MWVCLNNAFLSIVSKDCKPAELLVRARRPGDIQRVFPGAKVMRSYATDYRFRAVIKRDAVSAAMAREVNRIDYPNFKDSVKNDALHNVYMRIWHAVLALQPVRVTDPYAGMDGYR